MGPVLRVLATPRWIGWTLLAVVALVVCGVMSYWQFIRAESPGGSLLNAGYAFQWPIFGLFFGALWWRMLVAEARDTAPPAPAADGGAAPARARRAEAELEPVRAPDPSSPFTARPAGVLPGAGAGTPVRDRHRTDYNAMLAALATTPSGTTPSGDGTGRRQEENP